ncbi:hypothetical protein [Variovorax ginsengisoli]|uniref:Uncharacterized protein n=1 Tax=Variovorax ginsengisoli TaxID=363844 RepID=A0ABT8SC48_9BURK|nr:hypothetical protein [Variovorax ginsengisoli]MDN8617316.1 hypothetical protein [Variovorax ginsengisoli]MDO1536486.1 hypothetical protein [Variovorax ginsengisoli]
MLTFLTLGPEGSNHDFVLRRYLAAHGVADHRARISLIDDFHEGARALKAGKADFMLQCAVHPQAAAVTGGYRKEVFVVDAFISPSRPMALLRARAPRKEVAHIAAVQPATQSYADLSAWSTIVHETTVSEVGRGLVDGRYAAGIAFSALADEHPGVFEVVEDIGAVCDAWIMYGVRPVDGGQAIVWTGSPVSSLYGAAGD